MNERTYEVQAVAEECRSTNDKIRFSKIAVSHRNEEFMGKNELKNLKWR